jgi:hypothetical protein
MLVNCADQWRRIAFPTLEYQTAGMLAAAAEPHALAFLSPQAPRPIAYPHKSAHAWRNRPGDHFGRCRGID